MTVDITFLLRHAIFEYLNTQQELLDVLGNPLRLYEEIPVTGDAQLDTEFPFAQYIEGGKQDDSTNTCKFYTHSITLDVWDGGDYEGTARAGKIDAILNSLLDNKESLINIAPAKLVMIQYQNTITTQSTDGQAWLVRSTYQALTEIEYNG